MEDIVGKEFLQSCGDILRVLNKTEQKDKYNHPLYECEFLKYPYKLLLNKQYITRGAVDNPQIEVVEFIEKEWKQNCGDSLKILEKTNIRNNKGKGNILFRCQFQKYPCEILETKDHILRGCVDNPKIEEEEFVNKIWEQNCGDFLRIIKKTDEKRNNEKEFLFECEFVKYPCRIKGSKYVIQRGQIDNPALPWKSKEGLYFFIKNNFPDYKPSLQELAKKLNLSRQKTGKALIEFSLREEINYWIGDEENSLKSFIEELIGNKLQSFYKNKYEIDIFIPNFQLGFEFNGNYWHSNLFKENNYHQDKKIFFEKENIEIINIFEFEWLDKQEICKSLIKAKFEIFDKKIGARQCQIKELDNKTYQDFCNQNHLQGEAGAKVKLGLYCQDELVQVMSFGCPRFTSDFDWEIIRECSKLNYCILGGKQKLWKYFIKKYSPNNCISYCDFSKFNGDSYLKLGFKKERLNKPGFWWYDENTKEVFWRNPYKNREMKEKEYNKIFDCGQLVFSWYKN